MRVDETDHPLLYEINTRIWVRELIQKPNVTLADIPDGALEDIAGLNFDLVWLMGVWQTGEAGLTIARNDPFLRKEYGEVLSDFVPEDVIGSPYAVQEYRVSNRLGGPESLAQLRRRLAERGIGLILDFVPNHTALDHPWVFSRPEFYIAGDEDSIRRGPENYFAAKTLGGEKFLAHGRDPNFPGWSDTAQLNIRHRGARDALIETLKGIALQCDGVRCDMSMLLLSDVFSRTWGERAKPADGSPPAEGEFWVAAIDAVRRRNPKFIFVAEAYWGLEPVLQDLGFDYTYDKTLYEKLISDGGWGVRNRLGADLDFQFRSLRFLENHDEPRAAGLLFKDKHRAAALVFSTVPGMRLFHEGQLEGYRVRVPVQIGRRPRDQDLELRDFYRKLLADLGKRIMRRGRWKRLDPRPAWEGNDSWNQFVVHRWEADRQGARLVAVNYGAERAQCYVSVDLAGLRGRRVLLKDLLSGASYERGGDSLKNPGLYLDLGPYEGQLFTLLSL